MGYLDYGPRQAIQLEGYDEMMKLLDPKIVEKAAGWALAKAVKSGRTVAADRIYSRYNIKKRDINRAVKAVFAPRNKGTAEIIAKGRPMSLTYFGAKWIRNRNASAGGSISMTRKKTTLRKRRTGRSGVYAQIMRGGDVTHKQHAFIVAVSTKRSDVHHTGVFERIPGSRMASNPKKEKIVERKLVTMASMFGRQDVWDPTVERIGEVWDSEFPRLIDELFSR